MELQSLSVGQRIALLLKALDGAQRTNEALARCSDGEEMLDVLLAASKTLGLGLSRQELKTTPPIRDWIWWKNKEALLTIGDNTPRYHQDGSQGRAVRQGMADRQEKAVRQKKAVREAEPDLQTGPDAQAGPPPDGTPPNRKKFLGLF